MSAHLLFHTALLEAELSFQLCGFAFSSASARRAEQKRRISLHWVTSKSELTFLQDQGRQNAHLVLIRFLAEETTKLLLVCPRRTRLYEPRILDGVLVLWLVSVKRETKDTLPICDERFGHGHLVVRDWAEAHGLEGENDQGRRGDPEGMVLVSLVGAKSGEAGSRGV